MTMVRDKVDLCGVRKGKREDEREVGSDEVKWLEGLRS